MLAVAMPENPTYRVTGEDWDAPAPDRTDAPRVLPPPAQQPGTPTQPSAAAPPAVTPPGLTPLQPRQPASAPPPAGWATPVAAGTPVRPTDVPAPAPSPAAGGQARKAGAANPLSRLPAPIGPALAGIPPRVLLGGAGLVAAAVVFVIFASAGSNDVAATATTTPTEAAPVATIGCETPAAPLGIPDLVVRALDGTETHLAGFASPDAEVGLDGPWPAQLGSVEANLELGSTLRLVSPGPCIAEWRAVAAPPPATTSKSWRPDALETQQLGWQHADRVGWQPTFKLPPRGEWIIRLTVWYRDAAGARAATPAPSASSTDAGATAGDWVVERYFRIVVEARGASE